MAFDYADPMTPEIAEIGRSKKRTTTFLKMFRFDKARTPKNQMNQTEDNINQSSVADQSIDYANYLLEIQEGKQSILQGLRDKTKRASGTTANNGLIKGDVKRETIDFYDLRESGAQKET